MIDCRKGCKLSKVVCTQVFRHLRSSTFLPCQTLTNKFEIYSSEINKVKYYDTDNIAELIDYILDKDIELEDTLQLIKIKNEYTV